MPTLNHETEIISQPDTSLRDKKLISNLSMLILTNKA